VIATGISSQPTTEGDAKLLEPGEISRLTDKTYSQKNTRRLKSQNKKKTLDIRYMRNWMNDSDCVKMPIPPIPYAFDVGSGHSAICAQPRTEIQSTRES